MIYRCVKKKKKKDKHVNGYGSVYVPEIYGKIHKTFRNFFWRLGVEWLVVMDGEISLSIVHVFILFKF